MQDSNEFIIPLKAATGNTEHGITFFTGGIRGHPPKDEPGGLPTTFAAYKRPAGYEVDPMP